MSNGNGYEIYIVVRDRDYPLPTEPDPRSAWEAGWYGWTGKAGDIPVAVFGANEYEDALAKAEELSVMDGDTSDIEVLQDVLTKYKVWVDENQPYSGTANTDGKAMSYADFDEERADWYEQIVVAAEGVAGFSWDSDSADAMEVS